MIVLSPVSLSLQIVKQSIINILKCLVVVRYAELVVLSICKLCIIVGYVHKHKYPVSMSVAKMCHSVVVALQRNCECSRWLFWSPVSLSLQIVKQSIVNILNAL